MKPIYLYIKTHNQTGLKYFGKTIQDPFTYPGSGVRWTNHLKQHGNDVKTEVVGCFEDKDECKLFALEFSKDNNIVKSEEWANLKVEDLDGGFDHIDRSAHSKFMKQRVHSEDEKRKRRLSMIGWPSRCKLDSLQERSKKLHVALVGKKMSDEFCKNISFKMKGNQNKKGKTVSEEGRIRISDGHKGLKLSDECKKKISQKKKSTITVLDKDNEVWVNIPTEEYYSNRNRFFAINSKIAKDFKAAHSRK